MKNIFVFALSITLFGLISLQSCKNKPKKESLNGESDLNKTQTAKFDGDDLPDSFIIQKGRDENIHYILSVSLSKLNTEVKILLLNNSILYNNNESYYNQSIKLINDKICEVTIKYPNQKSIPNISGEKKNLVEKIKYNFDSNKNRIRVISYDLSYQKDTRDITKSFNFVTGKFIAIQKNNGKTTSTSGWSADLENIYVEDWNIPFVRDKIFWYGNEVE